MLFVKKKGGGHVVKKQKSLFAMMVALSVLCVTVVTLIVVLSATKATKNFEKQFIDIEQTETDAIVNMLDNTIFQTLARMYPALINNHVSQTAVYFEDGKYSLQFQTAAEGIQKNLAALEISTDLPWNVAIYFPKSHKKITSSTVLSYKEDDGLFGFLHNKISVAEGSLILSISQPFSQPNNYRDATAILVCEMPLSRFSAYLQKFSEKEDISQFIIAVKDNQQETQVVAPYDILTETTLGFVHELMDDAHKEKGFFTLNEQKFLLTWQKSQELPGLYLLQITDAKRITDEISDFAGQSILSYMGITLVLLSAVYALFIVINRSISRTTQVLKGFDEGNLDIRIGKSPYQEFNEMYRQFDKMAQRIQRLIETEYELRLLHFKAELKQIQYQINPHFLYNTYFILRAMLYNEEYEEATELANLMGRYLRYITVSQMEFAALSEEIEHTHAYGAIQQLRFKGKAEVVFHPCPPDFLSMRVPRLILQPLVENAFLHGIKDMEGQGTILVHFKPQGEDLIISVEDNGKNFDDDEAGALSQRLLLGEREAGDDGSVALLNIHKRLKMIYGPQSGIVVSRSPLGGACIAMKLVQSKEENNVPPVTG